MFLRQGGKKNRWRQQVAQITTMLCLCRLCLILRLCSQDQPPNPRVQNHLAHPCPLLSSLLLPPLFLPSPFPFILSVFPDPSFLPSFHPSFLPPFFPSLVHSFPLPSLFLSNSRELLSVGIPDGCLRQLQISVSAFQ